MTLSAAVAQAYSDSGATPAVVNLQVNGLITPDSQVNLDKPIIINGDAEDTNSDGTPDGDGIQCDIIADMSAMTAATINGTFEQNVYISITAPGLVEISDLKIHPDEDGEFNNSGAGRELDIISGIRMFKPTNALDVGTYHLTRVYVSGSDASGAFIDLDTGEDLYNGLNVKRWGGHSGFNKDGIKLNVADSDNQYADDAAIQIGNGSGAGTYSTILDHCHAGLSKSSALNINANVGTHQVLGGVYGHCARDGIRVDGTGITIEGTANDRVRVVRNTNIESDNSHSIEVANGAELLSLRYADVAGLNTANNFNFRGGTVTLVEFCRGMGKFDDGTNTPRNQTVFIDNTNTVVGTIQNSTFHGLGANPSPFTIDPGILDTVDVKNCIFTSANLGTLNINSAANFTNCALPSDGTTNESLAASPNTGTGATFLTAPVSSSPFYQATLVNYDWSNVQGGDGNADVLRPGNSSAYAMAAEGNAPLVGGAGGTEVPVSLSGFSIE